MSANSFIIGAGMSRFGKQAKRTIEDLGLEAVRAAMADAGVEREQIDEVFCGTGYGGPMLGQRIVRDLGMTGLPVTNVENACSSGATGLREACAAIAVGRAETVLVMGVDKLSKFGGGTLPLEPTDQDVANGAIMPAVYAMRATRYLAETGATPEHMAMVTVKARQAAAHNPHAQMRAPTTIEEVLASRPVAEPLTLFMCCPSGDGAAAVVVTNAKGARKAQRTPVRIAASVLQSGYYKTGFRDLTRSELTERTSRLAYEAAGIGPEDVDLAEVHDAFAIAELMYYEGLGFCEPGAGKDFLERGDSSLGGRKPVNPSGGLLCKGHPIGATGIAQICEAVWQLRHEAGARQVEKAKVALTHCTGGGISGFDHGACAVHILAI
jgi:acetyl-CoA acetyltransferase